jgi:hypothetical protein
VPPSDRDVIERSYAIERHPRLRILIPLVVAIGSLMQQLDSTIITTAVPRMASSLASTPVHQNRAVAAYVLALAVFIPLSGWFADRYGARRIFELCDVGGHARTAGIWRRHDDARRAAGPAARFPAPRARDRDDLHDTARHRRAEDRASAGRGDYHL